MVFPTNTKAKKTYVFLHNPTVFAIFAQTLIQSIMATLSRGTQVSKYTVQSLIKANLYTETYRVEDEEGNTFFMKVFVKKRTPEKLINVSSGVPYEIELIQAVKHKNIVSFIESGSLSSDEGDCCYYVTNYFRGELLVEKILREGKIEQEEAKTVFRNILEGLQCIHSKDMCHNDITPRNIMLSDSLSGLTEIIDMGHLSHKCSGKVCFDTADLDLFYCANETFAGMYDEQTDIFAATAVLYTMLTGDAPWKMEFKEDMRRARKALLLKDKRKSEPIDFSALPVEDHLKAVLAKGLALDSSERYKDVEQILNDLDSESEVRMPSRDERRPAKDTQREQARADSASPNSVAFEIKRGGGKGFEDIAGMRDLKAYLSKHVIFVIQNKEKAEKYRLATPNGMLLYGPPGCGKTFVAEKFAEETGFNFILVKSSDLASSFVHGSQEKIAQLFKTAEKNAPMVICFDEFDALVPDRSNPAAQYSAGEVNEFLSQLNNCSQKGIFIIGTTNRPDKIDPAVLRTGRIDKQVYVPLPDKEARREMFLIHLKGRPFDEKQIDVDKLSEMTEGYIASDIAYVVNDAAMTAAYTDQDITEQILESSVRDTHPSLRADTMKIYDNIHRMMEDKERQGLSRPRIGFPTTLQKD